VIHIKAGAFAVLGMIGINIGTLALLGEIDQISLLTQSGALGLCIFMVWKNYAIQKTMAQNHKAEIDAIIKDFREQAEKQRELTQKTMAQLIELHKTEIATRVALIEKLDDRPCLHHHVQDIGDNV
jgi:hypothetical protein